MHILGDGRDIIFLTDLWHPNGRLTDWVDADFIEEICLRVDCNLSDFLDDNGRKSKTFGTNQSFTITPLDKLKYLTCHCQHKNLTYIPEARPCCT